jgi:glycosyltransferase involved in cell wall biosynthesis
MLSTTLKKISCLLVTNKWRFDFVRRSLQCYLDQTYPNRELLIVNEGPSDYQKQIQEHVDGLKRTDIRCVWLKGYYTLGALRNISVALATGDLVCQWDDDDYCMPQRLATQYSFLLNRPQARVCYLSDQLHYYYHTNELYWDNWAKYQSANMKRNSLVPGTVMAYRTIPVRYPSAGKFCSAGEDSVYSDACIRLDYNSVVLMPNFGYMHVYCYHGTNQVYGIDHHSNISRCRSEPIEHMLANRGRLTDTIRYLKFPGETKVMGRDGLAFTCRGDDAQVS